MSNDRLTWTDQSPLPKPSVLFWADLGFDVQYRDEIPQWAWSFLQNIPTSAIAADVLCSTGTDRYRFRPKQLIKYLAANYQDAAFAISDTWGVEMLVKFTLETYEADKGEPCPFIYSQKGSRG